MSAGSGSGSGSRSRHQQRQRQRCTLDKTWNELTEEKFAANGLGWNARDWPCGYAGTRWFSCSSMSAMNDEDRQRWTVLGFDEELWSRWGQRQRAHAHEHEDEADRPMNGRGCVTVREVSRPFDLRIWTKLNITVNEFKFKLAACLRNRGIVDVGTDYQMIALFYGQYPRKLLCDKALSACAIGHNSVLYMQYES